MLSRLSGIGTDTLHLSLVSEIAAEEIMWWWWDIIEGRVCGLWGDNGNHMRARRGSVFVFIWRGYRWNRQSGTLGT